MRYMLDTNICIELIRGRSKHILAKLRRHPVGTVCISSITLAELQFGVARSSDSGRDAIALAHMITPLEMLSFDDHAAAAYGRARADLERAGTPIGALDTLIAAHALSAGAILVTNNRREFDRVAGLHVENWLAK